CGFEHSVANMTIFSVALLGDHPPQVSLIGALHNLAWVTLGNAIAGVFFMAGAYRWASEPLMLLAKPVARVPAAAEGAACRPLPPRPYRRGLHERRLFSRAKTLSGRAGRWAERPATGERSGGRQWGGCASWPGRRATRGHGPLRGRGQEAPGAREMETGGASLRRLCASYGTGQNKQPAQAARQFPLALLWPVLRGSHAEQLYVPLTPAEWYSQLAPVCRRGRPGGALRRWLRTRNHACQPADPRDFAPAHD